MMLIPCPYCGPRDVTEYTYGGDAAGPPGAPDAMSLAAWNDFVYLRDNPRGPHAELWQHSGGCRRWLRVKRDTLTHEVFETVLAAGTRKP
jgi:heterotetrameric sarcosine oxidase delta subunit